MSSKRPTPPANLSKKPQDNTKNQLQKQKTEGEGDKSSESEQSTQIEQKEEKDDKVEQDEGPKEEEKEGDDDDFDEEILFKECREELMEIYTLMENENFMKLDSNLMEWDIIE